jgi:hypothetical protein
MPQNLMSFSKCILKCVFYNNLKIDTPLNVPQLIMENRKMSTYNKLDLETLGYPPTMPKNLPGHCKEHTQIS